MRDELFVTDADCITSGGRFLYVPHLQRLGPGAQIDRCCAQPHARQGPRVHRHVRGGHARAVGVLRLQVCDVVHQMHADAWCKIVHELMVAYISKDKLELAAFSLTDCAVAASRIPTGRTWTTRPLTTRLWRAMSLRSRSGRHGSCSSRPEVRFMCCNVSA